MAQATPKTVSQPQAEARDLERLVNEGGPDPVPSKEIAQREKVWIEAQEQHGGTENVVAALNHETAERLRQQARQQGVTFETLLGTVLTKYSHDQFAERHLEAKQPTPP